MPREARTFITLSKLPETLPDNLELVHAKKTLGSYDKDGEPVMIEKVDKDGNVQTDKDGKPVKVARTIQTVCKFLVPKLNNAGPGAYQKFRKENGAPDNEYYIAAALRSAIVGDIGNLVSAEEADTSSLILPPAPSVRLVDPSEATGEIVKNVAMEAARSGKSLSVEELAKMLHAALAGTGA